ncbi:MAG: hypothetical protein FWB80_03255 [Defluviitaleaceae bacterium]|nr:hypothetical protein [Defluviitaleaceae bacterium]
MFNWNDRFNSEPIPPPEPETFTQRMERFIEKHGKGRCFLVAFAVLAVLLIAIIIGLSIHTNAYFEPGMVVFALIGVGVIAYGIAAFIYAHGFWEFAHMFTVQGGEPTDWAIFKIRMHGVFMIGLTYFFAVAMFF